MPIQDIRKIISANSTNNGDTIIHKPNSFGVLRNRLDSVGIAQISGKYDTRWDDTRYYNSWSPRRLQGFTDNDKTLCIWGGSLAVNSMIRSGWWLDFEGFYATRPTAGPGLQNLSSLLSHSDQNTYAGAASNAANHIANEFTGTNMDWNPNLFNGKGGVTITNLQTLLLTEPTAVDTSYAVDNFLLAFVMIAANGIYHPLSNSVGGLANTIQIEAGELTVWGADGFSTNPITLTGWNENGLNIVVISKVGDDFTAFCNGAIGTASWGDTMDIMEFDMIMRTIGTGYWGEILFINHTNTQPLYSGGDELLLYNWLANQYGGVLIPHR